MSNTLMSTGFRYIDEHTGGFQRHTTTLILAPDGFGKTEYAHYLVNLADTLEIASVVVTPTPDEMEHMTAYADYVLKVKPDDTLVEIAPRLEMIQPDLVIVDGVHTELALEMSHRVRNVSTLIMFMPSLAHGGIPSNLRDAFKTSELVLLGSIENVAKTNPEKFWHINKNKFGSNGVGEKLSARVKGGWES